MIIYFNSNVKLNVGDVVSTTTSEFPYDNYYSCFVDAKDLNNYADVDVKFHHSDYDEYDPRTCRDGGNYGYDYYTVIKIYEVGKL